MSVQRHLDTLTDVLSEHYARCPCQYDTRLEETVQGYTVVLDRAHMKVSTLDGVVFSGTLYFTDNRVTQIRGTLVTKIGYDTHEGRCDDRTDERLELFIRRIDQALTQARAKDIALLDKFKDTLDSMGEDPLTRY